MDIFLIILIFLNFLAAVLLFAAYTLYGPWMSYILAKITGKDILMILSKTNKVILYLTNFKFDYKDNRNFPWSCLERNDRIYRFGDRRISIVCEQSGTLAGDRDPYSTRKITELKEAGVKDYEDLVRIAEKDEDVKNIFFRDIPLRDVIYEIQDVSGEEISPYIDIKAGKMREKLMKELGGAS